MECTTNRASARTSDSFLVLHFCSLFPLTIFLTAPICYGDYLGFGFLSIPPKSAKYEKSTFSLQGLKFRKRPPVSCNSVCKMVGCQIQYWQLRRCWVPLMRLEWPDYIKRLPVVAVDPGLQKRKTSTNGFRLTLGSRQQLHGLTPRVDKMAHSGWRNTHLDTAMMGLTLRSTNPKDTQRFVVPIKGL